MSITAPTIGVVVTSNEIPPPSGVPTNTATAFMVGRADQGPANTYSRITSVVNFQSVYGARSTTNSVLYDSVDAMFRMGVPQIYVGRVVGPSPVNASLTLQDAGGHPTMVVTTDTTFGPGINGNGLYVVVTVSGGTYTITLQDVSGNVIAQSPTLANQAAGIAWSAVAPYITITASTGSGFTTNNPVALAATALTGGTDDFTDATLTQWQAALGLFPFSLGPGQVLAPGQTNTTLNGIWSALDFHGFTNNRFACKDLESTSPAAQISAISAIAASGFASWGIFDQPSAQIPAAGNASSPVGTTRTVPASAIRAGLCAMVDALGNPNRAASGRSFPIPYVTNFNWFGGAQTSDSNVLLLEQAGINTFELRYGVLESFGFATPASPLIDPIYWQASHSRLRMAIVADAYAVGEPFVFGQIDGAQVEINAFGTAISSMLANYAPAPLGNGALFGDTPADAYSVDVGPAVNTPATIAAGELKAAVAVRMAPYAQLVEIDISAVPTTQALP